MNCQLNMMCTFFRSSSSYDPVFIGFGPVSVERRHDLVREFGSEQEDDDDENEETIDAQRQLIRTTVNGFIKNVNEINQRIDVLEREVD